MSIFMAEESTDPLIIITTPEKSESITTKIDSNSAENPLFPSHEFGSPAASKRRVPIYLRASTGSCHDICKYGKHHAAVEKRRESLPKRISKSPPNEAIEPLRARVSKSSSPNELKPVKIISDEKNKGRVVFKHEPSDDYTEKVKISPRTKSCSPELLYNSPRQSALPGNKTRLTNLSPSAKVEVPIGSNDSKMSRADEKMCDQSVNRSSPVKSKLIKVKPLIASGDSYGVRTGRKMTSSMTSADKASETPVSRLSLGKTSSSKAREPGRAKSSLSLSSPPKYRNGTEKSNGEDFEKTLHVIKTETETEKDELNLRARNPGRVKSSLSSSLNRRKSTEKSNSEDDHEKTLHVIKTETEKNELNPRAGNPGRVKSSLSSSLNRRKSTKKSNGEDDHEKTLHVIKTETEKNELNPRAGNLGRVKPSLSSSLNRRKSNEKSNGGDDHEKTLCVIKTETGKDELNSRARNPRRVKPSLSSPLNRRKSNEKSNGEDDHEKTLHVIKTETENNASASSSSRTSSSHAKSPSSSSPENDDDEKIDYRNNKGDELIGDEIISSEIKNLQPMEENHDKTPTLSSHEDDDDDDDDDEEVYPSSSSSSSSPSSSSSESLSHANSSSLSSPKENEEEINGGDDMFVYSNKTIPMEIGNVQPPKENRKKSKSILTDDKNCSPVKLNFRRGKIIDLQPENNVPKRLRFRRARIGGHKTDDFFFSDNKKSTEIGNGKTVNPNKALRKADSFISENKKSTDVKPGIPNKPLRKSRREKTVDLHAGNNSPTRLKYTRSRVPRAEDGKSDILAKKNIKRTVNKNEAVGFEVSSGRVVLKHPEVQREKNGRVLLNNVIEETASKLVESRKSKVKALVGAFETVISLQEPKKSLH